MELPFNRDMGAQGLAQVVEGVLQSEQLDLQTAPMEFDAKSHKIYINNTIHILIKQVYIT